jgi:hypothetical protein
MPETMRGDTIDIMLSKSLQQMGAAMEDPHDDRRHHRRSANKRRARLGLAFSRQCWPPMTWNAPFVCANIPKKMN